MDLREGDGWDLVCAAVVRLGEIVGGEKDARRRGQLLEVQRMLSLALAPGLALPEPPGAGRVREGE